VCHVGQNLPGIKDILGKRWNILWQGSTPFIIIFLIQRSNKMDYFLIPKSNFKKDPGNFNQKYIFLYF